MTSDLITSAESAAVTTVPSAVLSSALPLEQRSRRIAAIGWDRGEAMLLMGLDHVFMALVLAYECDYLFQ